METLAGSVATPASADNTGLVESVEADAGTAKTNADGSAPSVPEADTPAPKDKVQERFDKLTREKYDALREVDLARYQVEHFKAQLAQMDKSEKEQAAPANEFPTLEQFGYDEGKFNAAVAAHYSKLAIEQARTATREQIEQERNRQQEELAGRNWATKEAEFIKSKPDYVEKVREARSLPISREIQMELKSSELGPQVAYYLVENLDKAAAIMALTIPAQLREIGRIEARLELAKAPPKPAVSQAPPPVAKVESNSESTLEKKPEDMVGASPKEFAKWRKKHKS